MYVGYILSQQSDQYEEKWTFKVAQHEIKQTTLYKREPKVYPDR